MNALSQKLRMLLQDRQIIPFSEYMERCLFDPEEGYYTRLNTIGRAGDFITAPEISAHFAKAIASFLLTHWASFTHPVLVELGGGTGQFAFDLLQALQQAGVLPCRYLIIEKSRSLRAKQEAVLQGLDPVIRACIEWHGELSEQGLNGMIIANEFFDALPVERFKKTSTGLQRVGVIWNGRCFEEALMEEEIQATHLDHLKILPGYCSEVCPMLASHLTPLLHRFNKGLIVVIDYGEVREKYYHPLRFTGSLRAYAKHQIASVWDSPGQNDITADVDFTYLAELLVSAGWTIGFLKPQVHFLLEQGILPDTGIAVDQYSLKYLLDPRLMGTRFKVLTAMKTPIV